MSGADSGASKMSGKRATSFFSKGERHSLTKILRRSRWRCKTFLEAETCAKLKEATLLDEKPLDRTEEILSALSKLKSTGELKVAAYNEQFATDDTEKKSETCLGREEITQIIRQEVQSQHFSGQRKEANKICYYCGRGERPYFTILSEAPIRFDWRPTIRL